MAGEHPSHPETWRFMLRGVGATGPLDYFRSDKGQLIGLNTQFVAAICSGKRLAIALGCDPDRPELVCIFSGNRMIGDLPASLLEHLLATNRSGPDGIRGRPDPIPFHPNAEKGDRE